MAGCFLTLRGMGIINFMLLANLNITKEPMEVGPTTHYIMGGVRVDAETQMSNVPGLFAAGEVAAGLHGANRLGGNSLSDLLVFGKRTGEFAAKFAREHDAGQFHDGQIEETVLEALEPFERAAKAAGNAEGAYQVQIDLQEMMQSLVGIVRRKEEMVRALDGLGKLWKRSQNVAVHGHREYNPGWHTAIDLKHLLTVSEAVTRSALERKENRGGHFRDDFPNKDAAGGKMNIVLRKDVDGRCECGASQSRTVFKIWRGDANGGDFVEYIAEISEGICRARRRPRDSSDAGQ